MPIITIITARNKFCDITDCASKIPVFPQINTYPPVRRTAAGIAKKRLYTFARPMGTDKSRRVDSVEFMR
jgi:hypothetical protein